MKQTSNYGNIVRNKKFQHKKEDTYMSINSKKWEKLRRTLKVELKIPVLITSFSDF